MDQIPKFNELRGTQAFVEKYILWEITNSNTQIENIQFELKTHKIIIIILTTTYNNVQQEKWKKHDDPLQIKSAILNVL